MVHVTLLHSQALLMHVYKIKHGGMRFEDLEGISTGQMHP